MSVFLTQTPPCGSFLLESQPRHFSPPWYSSFPISALHLLPTLCPGVQKEARASCFLFFDSKMTPSIYAASPDPPPMPVHGENGVLRSLYLSIGSCLHCWVTEGLTVTLSLASCSNWLSTHSTMDLRCGAVLHHFLWSYTNSRAPIYTTRLL